MSKKPPVQKTVAKQKTYGKSKGYFQTNIQSSDSGNGDLTFVATVHSQKDFQQAEVRWKLPDHLKIISGEKEAVVNFKAGEKKELKVTVDKALLKEGDHIILFVHKTMRGEKHGTSHSFIYKENNEVQSSGLNQKSKKRPKYFE